MLPALRISQFLTHIETNKKQTSVAINSKVLSMEVTVTLFIHPICQLADENTYVEIQDLVSYRNSRER